MARVVALKLQSPESLAVVARTGGRKIEVEAVVPIPLVDGDDARSTGAKVAAALAPFNAAKLAAVVAVPRCDLHWANYDLPPSPATELPEMVQMQAARDVVIADDGIGFDFLSLHGDEEHPHRVLAVGVSPAHLERIRTICTAADLKLQRIVPEPLGWVELGRRVPAEAGDKRGPLSVFAASAGRQAGVWAMEDDALRLVRTVWLASEDETPDDFAVLAGELRRTLISLSQMAGAPSAALPCTFCGAHAEAAAGQLAAALGRPVRAAALDDLVNAPIEDASEVAPLAALAAAIDRPSPIDLLHPHRPPAPPSHKRTYALAGAAAACVAALLAWTAYRNIHTPLDAAAAADAERLKLGPTLEKMEEIEKQAAAVNDWLGSSVNLLTELDYLGQHLRPKPLDDKEFNSGEDLVITKLTVAGRQITIDAAARSTEALQPIERRLRDANYRVSRNVLESQEQPSTPGYSAHASAVLERRPDAPAAPAEAAP